jgi:hypothetical protein
MTFNKLEKNNIINLYFRGIQNTLPDRELRDKPRNKILKSIKQKTVPKPLKQFKD